MSDLHGSNESEDMCSFLQILLQNSSSSAVATDGDSAAAGGLFSGGGAVVESFTSFSFSNPSFFFARESDRMNHTSNLASSYEGPEDCDVGMGPAPPRSLKRSRAAEVHNLSEKRRRSRINEKLKALQNLIPNSNKTDKASMLDEAIEYLKQLQLQVQMLTMRNGLSLHPGYSVGPLQSTLAPSAALDLDANRGQDTLSVHQNVYMQGLLEPANHSSLNVPMLMPSTRHTNNNNSGFLSSSLPSMENSYGLPNQLSSTKDISRDDSLSRLQFDISCSRNNNSSPGISS